MEASGDLYVRVIIILNRDDKLNSLIANSRNDNILLIISTRALTLGISLYRTEKPCRREPLLDFERPRGEICGFPSEPPAVPPRVQPQIKLPTSTFTPAPRVNPEHRSEGNKLPPVSQSAMMRPGSRDYVRSPTSRESRARSISASDS